MRIETICDGNWILSRESTKSVNEVSSSSVVDFVVAPKVWSSGIFVRRRLVREVRVNVDDSRDF